MVIRWRPGDAAAFASTGSYPTVAVPASGHVVIVGPNNTFIGVGEPECEQAPERSKAAQKRYYSNPHLLKVRCCIDDTLGDNMRRVILHVVLCLGCALASCLNVASGASNGSEASPPLDEEKYQAYVEKIAKATREDADRIAPQYPPSGETFDELAAAGAENIDLCIRYLAESKETERPRFIAFTSMYKLDVDHYVVFVRKLVELHHRGLLSDGGLSYGLRPRYSDLVIEQYQNPKIEALLKEMAAQEDIPPDVKADIKYIRSGEGFARKRRNDFDRECTSWSQMRSIAACVSLATQILWVSAVSLTW
jgi:hypothetical protein